MAIMTAADLSAEISEGGRILSVHCIGVNTCIEITALKAILDDMVVT